MSALTSHGLEPSPTKHGMQGMAGLMEQRLNLAHRQQCRRARGPRGKSAHQRYDRVLIVRLSIPWRRHHLPAGLQHVLCGAQVLVRAGLQCVDPIYSANR
jgi:hypothetical protein